MRQGTFLPVVLGILFILLLVATTWLGVEKARLSYEVEQYRRIIREKTEFLTKLETEKDLLLAPSRLQSFAKEFKLSPVQKGHLRSITLPKKEESQESVTIILE